MTVYELIMRVREGGSLVSATLCSSAELALARAEDRAATDSDGFTYVYKPVTSMPPRSGQSGRYKATR